MKEVIAMIKLCIFDLDGTVADTLAFHFSECKALLKDIGFKYIYTYYKSEFVKERI